MVSSLKGIQFFSKKGDHMTNQTLFIKFIIAQYKNKNFVDINQRKKGFLIYETSFIV